MNDAGLAVAPEPEVNAAVRAASAHFLDPIPAMPVNLAHLLLEILPRKSIQPADVEMLLKEGRPLLAKPPASNPGSEADHRRNGTQRDAEQPQLPALDGVLNPKNRHEE